MSTSVHPSPLPRNAGILLHPTSLPGAYGIGDLGNELIGFLDWASGAGIRVWQVLPLNPPGYGYSPYGCLSSFAGNPLLISPQKLLQDNLLDAAFVTDVPQFPDDHVDFERVSEYKFTLLRESFLHFNESGVLRDEFKAFATAESEWLDEYALFMTLKELNGGVAWWDWKTQILPRTSNGDVEFWKYVQFLFFRQWQDVREAAAARGITILGDVPIYVAHDSADVWGNRDLFQLDENGRPTVVAGVPPDYFSTTGQRWGNPLYRWEAMKETNYRWWISRVRANLRLADVIRLDHFRGFSAYWEIPAEEPTAIHGRWMPGPGIALFDAIREELGTLPLVAEDLGFITDDVHTLRKSINVPGMKILQFGFGEPDSPHLPHRYDCKTVAYTGTHDNDTAQGWFHNAAEAERDAARVYLGCNDEDIAWTLIRAAFTSVAETAIVPAQDILNLGSSARMNRPGAPNGNWSWRMSADALTHAHASKLRRLAELTGRV